MTLAILAFDEFLAGVEEIRCSGIALGIGIYSVGRVLNLSFS